MEPPDSKYFWQIWWHHRRYQQRISSDRSVSGFWLSGGPRIAYSHRTVQLFWTPFSAAALYATHLPAIHTCNIIIERELHSVSCNFFGSQRITSFGVLKNPKSTASYQQTRRQLSGCIYHESGIQLPLPFHPPHTQVAWRPPSFILSRNYDAIVMRLFNRKANGMLLCQSLLKFHVLPRVYWSRIFGRDRTTC